MCKTSIARSPCSMCSDTSIKPAIVPELTIFDKLREDLANIEDQIIELTIEQMQIRRTNPDSTFLLDLEEEIQQARVKQAILFAQYDSFAEKLDML